MSTLTPFTVEHRRIEYGYRDGVLLGTYPVLAADPRDAIAKLMTEYGGLEAGVEYLVARRRKAA